ncbi:MAG: dihydroorotate dehydrogenase electron transfer subunit [Candidatus Eisenbacteria bacterium]
MPLNSTATKPYCGLTRLFLREEIGASLFRIELDVPHDLSSARPGQFALLRVREGIDPLLGRPMAFHYVRKVRRTWRASFIVNVVGRGTRFLVENSLGAEIGFLGPLGQPFSSPRTSRDVNVLVGGGVGIPPLHFLARQLPASRKTYRQRWYAVLGAATREKLACVNEIAACGVTVIPCTDDGSRGCRTFVTTPLEDLLRSERGVGRSVYIYACGPEPMLRKVSELAAEHGAEGEISLERRLACGVGVCRACVCKIASEGEGERNALLCREGPVFPLGQVLFR